MSDSARALRTQLLIAFMCAAMLGYFVLLGRLAVSRDWQGCGLGGGLLKDAMRRTVQAADIAGIRAFAVHAKDDAAEAFAAVNAANAKKIDFAAPKAAPAPKKAAKASAKAQ